MPPTRALSRTARPTALWSAALLAAILAAAPDARAQEAEPGADAPAAAEPRARPKPKPKPAPRPTPAAATPAAAKPAAAPWPPGASSVSEGYGDWTVSCTKPADRAVCIVVQSQGDAKTGRRKFGIELQGPHDGRSEGIVLMPFGLAIEPGVTFKLDEQTLGKGAPYTSCNGEGCLVAISFPTLATDGMRTAKTLTVTGQKPGGTEPAVVTVPLTGFPQAFDRAVALGG